VLAAIICAGSTSWSLSGSYSSDMAGDELASEAAAERE
jgi:hypothetical protein